LAESSSQQTFAFGEKESQAWHEKKASLWKSKGLVLNPPSTGRMSALNPEPHAQKV
jgi:hypothetical protein